MVPDITYKCWAILTSQHVFWVELGFGPSWYQSQRVILENLFGFDPNKLVSKLGSIAHTKLEIEKFDWKNDFNLWKVKMEATLVHQGLDVILEKNPSGNDLLMIRNLNRR